MSEKKKSNLQDSLDDFLSDFDEEKIEKSSKLEILPKLEIEGTGIENAKIVKVLSGRYMVEIPVEKSMSDDNHLWIIDMEYEKTKHQIIAQAKSFRYQYAVIMKKCGINIKDQKATEHMIGAIIKIWLEEVELEKWGKQNLYKIELIKAPPK